MLKAFLAESQKIVHNFLFQADEQCLLCGQRGFPVCAACRRDYFLPELRRCRSCGKIGVRAVVCTDCASGKGPQHFQGVVSLGVYSGAWKQYIHKVKYGNQPYLLSALEPVLTAWLVACLPPPDLIVPVPMHELRLAERGYNQAEVLASVIGRSLGIPQRSLLLRQRDTAAQSALGRQERLHNVRGAFAAGQSTAIAGYRIWLVDDVITTGATVAECAGILKAHGAGELYAVCLGAGRETPDAL